MANTQSKESTLTSPCCSRLAIWTSDRVSWPRLAVLLPVGRPLSSWKHNAQKSGITSNKGTSTRWWTLLCWTTTLDKKKTHHRDSRREERCSTCDIMLDQARSAQGKSDLRLSATFALRWFARDRAWYHTRNSVLLAANLDDGSFFFVQGSTSQWSVTSTLAANITQIPNRCIYQGFLPFSWPATEGSALTRHFFAHLRCGKSAQHNGVAKTSLKWTKQQRQQENEMKDFLRSP